MVNMIWLVLLSVGCEVRRHVSFYNVDNFEVVVGLLLILLPEQHFRYFT